MRTLTVRTAAAVVLPLTLAGCGASQHASTAGDPAARSGSSTRAVHQRVDSADFVAMVKAGASKLTTATFTMTMDMSGQQISADGALDLTGESPAMAMSMNLGGTGTAEDMRLVGGSMYIAVPGGNGTFMKLDLSDPHGPLGSMGNTLGSLDPQSLLDQVSPAMFKKVVYDGTASVQGERLKRYTVTIDTGAVPMLKGMPSSATASLPKAMTYDMWLDGQGRMARLTMLMKKVLSMTLRYSHFGAPVDIKAPDPSRVQAMPSTGSTS
jgi:hypothetical protein